MPVLSVPFNPVELLPPRARCRAVIAPKGEAGVIRRCGLWAREGDADGLCWFHRRRADTPGVPVYVHTPPDA